MDGGGIGADHEGAALGEAEEGDDHDDTEGVEGELLAQRPEAPADRSAGRGGEDLPAVSAKVETSEYGCAQLRMYSCDPYPSVRPTTPFHRQQSNIIRVDLRPLVGPSPKVPMSSPFTSPPAEICT